MGIILYGHFHPMKTLHALFSQVNTEHILIILISEGQNYFKLQKIFAQYGAFRVP
jgi:hypothetical protein